MFKGPYGESYDEDPAMALAEADASAEPKPAGYEAPGYKDPG